MKLYASFGVPIFLVLAILLASCGSGGGDAQKVDQGEKAEAGNRQTQGARITARKTSLARCQV